MPPAPLPSSDGSCPLCTALLRSSCVGWDGVECGRILIQRQWMTHSPPRAAASCCKAELHLMLMGTRSNLGSLSTAHPWPLSDDRTPLGTYPQAFVLGFPSDLPEHMLRNDLFCRLLTAVFFFCPPISDSCERLKSPIIVQFTFSRYRTCGFFFYHSQTQTFCFLSPCLRGHFIWNHLSGFGRAVGRCPSPPR